MLIVFLSTPSARRATVFSSRISQSQRISIHALREEGDYIQAFNEMEKKLFLSTPSARRATVLESIHCNNITISIHALREEGDRTAANSTPCT